MKERSLPVRVNSRFLSVTCLLKRL
jgi:hypothetical protein